MMKNHGYVTAGEIQKLIDAAPDHNWILLAKDGAAYNARTILFPLEEPEQYPCNPHSGDGDDLMELIEQTGSWRDHDDGIVK